MPTVPDLARDTWPRRLAIGLLRTTLWSAYRLMARIRVEGAKHVPQHGAVIWGEHSSAPLSPATGRASAGAIEHARLCRVPSLVGALSAARERGVAIIGLDSHAPERVGDLALTGPTILVVGNEHEGMGRGVRRACTAIGRLTASGRIDSLNASVAAALALHEAVTARLKSAT